MYTRPWTNDRTFTMLKGDLIEYSCEENNKDLRDGHIKTWTPPGRRDRRNASRTREMRNKMPNSKTFACDACRRRSARPAPGCTRRTRRTSRPRCRASAPTGPAPRTPRRQAGLHRRLAARLRAGHEPERTRPAGLRRGAVRAGRLHRPGATSFARRATTPSCRSPRAGLRGLEDLRSRQRRVHRQLHAVRPEPVDELARPDAGHAERQLHRAAVRAEHLVPHHLPRRPRRIPADLEPTWFGHSIGKWDGDTLIVDTVGFNGCTRLDTVGHPHSDALHMIADDARASTPATSPTR